MKVPAASMVLALAGLAAAQQTPPVPYQATLWGDCRTGEFTMAAHLPAHLNEEVGFSVVSGTTGLVVYRGHITVADENGIGYATFPEEAIDTKQTSLRDLSCFLEQPWHEVPCWFDGYASCDTYLTVAPLEGVKETGGQRALQTPPAAYQATLSGDCRTGEFTMSAQLPAHLLWDGEVSFAVVSGNTGFVVYYGAMPMDASGKGLATFPHQAIDTKDTWLGDLYCFLMPEWIDAQSGFELPCSFAGIAPCSSDSTLPPDESSGQRALQADAYHPATLSGDCMTQEFTLFARVPTQTYDKVVYTVMEATTGTVVKQGYLSWDATGRAHVTFPFQLVQWRNAAMDDLACFVVPVNDDGQEGDPLPCHYAGVEPCPWGTEPPAAEADATGPGSSRRALPSDGQPYDWQATLTGDCLSEEFTLSAYIPPHLPRDLVYYLIEDEKTEVPARLEYLHVDSDGLGVAIFPFRVLENGVSELSPLACHIMLLNKDGKATVVLPCAYAGITPCPGLSAEDVEAMNQGGRSLRRRKASVESSTGVR